MKYGRWTLVIVGVIVLSISAWAIAQQNGKAHKRLSTLERLTKAVDLTEDQQEKLKPEADKLDQAQADWRAALDKVLTPEQKEKLKSKFQHLRHRQGQAGAQGNGQGNDDANDKGN